MNRIVVLSIHKKRENDRPSECHGARKQNLPPKKIRVQQKCNHFCHTGTLLGILPKNLNRFLLHHLFRMHFPAIEATMGKAKQTRKFAVAKKLISPKDTRVRANAEKQKEILAAKQKQQEPRQVEQANSALFFQYNTQLGPPYHVLVDTNFINFSIRYVIFDVM
jgi:hypothetical protein